MAPYFHSIRDQRLSLMEGPIGKWHTGAFALRNPELDSRWVQKFSKIDKQGFRLLQFLIILQKVYNKLKNTINLIK